MREPIIVGIIPARFGSTRLPGKPLRPIQGVPLIVRVANRAREATRLSKIYIATDDTRIADAVEQAGHLAVLTRADHASGTDRVAEAAADLDTDLIVNIQGDQPFVDPKMIDECVHPLLTNPARNICTVRYPISRPEDFDDPAVVKVVVDLEGDALYFSRSLIPNPAKPVPHAVYEHVGLYAYRKETLLNLASLAPTPLEQIESLEQLRWLEHGLLIHVADTRCADPAFCGFSVDTEQDLERAEQMLRERGLS